MQLIVRQILHKKKTIDSVLAWLKSFKENNLKNEGEIKIKNEPKTEHWENKDLNGLMNELLVHNTVLNCVLASYEIKKHLGIVT